MMKSRSKALPGVTQHHLEIITNLSTRQNDRCRQL